MLTLTLISDATHKAHLTYVNVALVSDAIRKAHLTYVNPNLGKRCDSQSIPNLC